MNYVNLMIFWHFIPARSPNFGGLWEAGVKSVKHHLKRIISNDSFTYEEFSTLIIQIESILNSRPLTSLTNDPNDLDVLTPAHFLIGRPFTTIADPDVTDIPTARLSRYQYLQSLNRQFWRRWSKEYIHELQQRNKWRRSENNQLKLDDIVLIKEDNLPPAKWSIGRVIQLHPGIDKTVRVVTVKTASGTEIKRACSKLCVLPVGESKSEVSDN
uniref:DUF5641 domain-containing protein n=1 Tax=Photinus pyralis TaxID=7054 RepID=A0A1Y1MZS6_PHOPY